MAVQGGKQSVQFLSVSDKDKVMPGMDSQSPEGELEADPLGPQPCTSREACVVVSTSNSGRQGAPDRARVSAEERDGTRVVELGGSSVNELSSPDGLEGTTSNGRERLKRHRSEVAGRVWIPEIWGQEELLKDWVDCTVFDSSLVTSKIMSAKAALVEEGRRAPSPVIHVENGC
ncbi:hypothetical protein MLD38_020203 [Melastoma candidum]|uniref:Uncharacterized protein n=1 Tax=Melastoma candidum TaxID=119954 RepID=A0ACB9QC76_9MYRT|nr:hypothetical protein MLD38_020203 [Melastoma candidum]